MVKYETHFGYITHQTDCCERGTAYMERKDVMKIKYSIQANCGKRVVIKEDLGRNKVDVQEGVIVEANTNNFTVILDGKTSDTEGQRRNYMYNDIITKDIRLKLC